MILNGSVMTSGCALMDSRACKPVTSHQVFACFPHLPARTASLSIRSSWRPCQELKSWSFGGINIFVKHFVLLKRNLILRQKL